MEMDERILLDNLGKIAYTLDRAFLSKLGSDYGVLPFKIYSNDGELVSFSGDIRALRIKRCVLDREEKSSDCFKNIIGLFANSENVVALVLKRTPNSTKMYFVTRVIGKGGQNEKSKKAIEALKGALQGNLPGTEVDIIDKEDGLTTGKNTKSKFNFDSATALSVVSNLPTEKSENFLSQGINKLLESFVPSSDKESYTAVFLMEAIPLDSVRYILEGYEEMATAIIPFSNHGFQYAEGKTDTEGEMESLTNSKGVSHAVTKTHSVNIGVNGNLSSSVTKSKNFGANLGFTLGNKWVASVSGAISAGFGWAKAVTQAIGASAGYGYSWGTTESEQEGEAKATGTNRSISINKSKTTTYSHKSYMVSNLVDKLERVMKRIDESKSTGLWKYAAYVLGDDVSVTSNVANVIQSLTQGDDSFIEPSFLQSWQYTKSDKPTAFDEIKQYISHFCHPVFANLKDKDDRIPVTPAIEATTSELANVIAFPRHSVQGLPVLECARFGREPHSLSELENDVEIGCSYHMHKKEENNRISINREELTKHTFITGSTGSGKSNAIYMIINRLCYGYNKNKPHFLVIEPAKGEYKDVFRGYEGVSIYGTNPFKTPNLLQLNPFSFPDDTHVLEHIDRLVEVINACWPMYAAMPAILKESVEKAYEYVGWNLRTSKYPGEYPTFDTLMRVLPDVIDSSAYSSDTSNDYKGALITRVRSLTRGIHGQIFRKDIPASDLFNSNVIVDISRIGSSETKALIMGVLVLKLQEFRMSEGKINSPLRHITVLEEAHNLLRRTSAEQSQESSNLQGKSVEMIANAIAEMRTYGEGFIIADQSPGLMDMSVIRNTNTKIILRLPDEGDRILVGKAAGLNDLQITELTKLERGVAAISQSDWLEPILCHFDKFEKGISMDKRHNPDSFTWNDDESQAIKKFLRAAFDVEKLSLNQDEIELIRKWRDNLEVSEKTIAVIEYSLKQNQLNDTQKMLLMYNLVGKKINDVTDKESAIAEVNKFLIGRFDFDATEEVVRRINELFLNHFPVNVYLQESIMKADLTNKEGVR